jgi:nucleoside-diphosphate-sugar epimerase
MTNSLQQARRTALLIGATGGLGLEVTKALLRHGWRVKALVRDPATAAKRLAALGGVECVAGDAMRADDVTGAAHGVDLIVHAANPPGYRNWRGLAIPMLRNSIDAARTSGARLMFPGNVYNFAPQLQGPIAEDAPQQPRTVKGAVRVEMETMLREAAKQGVRSVVIRAGDFFGGHAPSSNFSNLVVKPGRPLKSVVYPGAASVGHAWAYLPDLAEVFAAIADRESDLPAFETYHFAGHWLEPGIALAQAVQRASGNPQLPIRSFPWPLLRVLSPFVPLFREVLEMRYLWTTPVALDNAKLVALLGREPRTPLDEAIGESLRALGCLPSRGGTRVLSGAPSVS